MKKLPSKLKIGAHTYKIDCSMTNEEFAGETNRFEQVIMIDKRLPPSEKMSTLIHEVFHVLNSTMSATKEGHNLVDSLAEQWADVLVNNKLI